MKRGAAFWGNCRGQSRKFHWLKWRFLRCWWAQSSFRELSRSFTPLAQSSSESAAVIVLPGIQTVGRRVCCCPKSLAGDIPVLLKQFTSTTRRRFLFRSMLEMKLCPVRAQEKRRSTFSAETLPLFWRFVVIIYGETRETEDLRGHYMRVEEMKSSPIFSFLIPLQRNHCSTRNAKDLLHLLSLICFSFPPSPSP